MRAFTKGCRRSARANRAGQGLGEPTAVETFSVAESSAYILPRKTHDPVRDAGTARLDAPHPDHHRPSRRRAAARAAPGALAGPGFVHVPVAVDGRALRSERGPVIRGWSWRNRSARKISSEVTTRIMVLMALMLGSMLRRTMP